VGSMDLLQDGASYVIQGPNNLSLVCNPSTNTATIDYVNNAAVQPEQIWEAKAMRGKSTGEMSGFFLMNRIKSTGHAWCLAATNPGRSGGPMGPPPRGSSVYMVDIQGADDYAIWTPNTTGHPNGELSLTNLMSFSGRSGPSLVLNVAGNSWQPNGRLIVWEWSGGEPNEIWWFQSNFKPA